MTKETLTEEYLAAVKRPAELVHDFHQENTPLEILDGKAFVIPNLLSEQECDDLIVATEEHGIDEPRKESGSARSAKRTTQYVNEDLAALVSDRIRSTVAPRFDGEDKDSETYMGPFEGIHSNWRVLRYDSGDAFPAHQDQMDSLQKLKKDGTKDLVVSSHTLLLNISKEVVEGGATRFYPKATPRGTSAGQYGYAVDVILPRGWALVFQQRGLIHCGQPVTSGPKYVAQAGVLRSLPVGKTIKPSVFRPAPGVETF